MKHWVPSALLILCLPASAGQIDQLSPDCRFSAGYAAPVEAAFGRATEGVPVASVTVLPSFDVEWSVRVTRQPDGSYLLQYLTFRTSALRTPQAGNPGYVAPPPVLSEAPISSELATGLGDLVATAIGAARKQESGYDVLDGIGYLFRAEGSTCAEIDSPPTGSQLENLTNIFQALRHMVLTTPNQREQEERAILHTVQTLVWRSSAVQPAQNRS